MATRKAIWPTLTHNGDFETVPVGTTATTNTNVWIDGTANGSATDDRNSWATNRGGTASALFDNSVSHSGTYSLKLATLATGSFMQARQVLGTANHLKLRVNGIVVLPSTSYTLTGWIKTTANSGAANSGARFAIVQYNSAATALTTGLSTAVTTTTGWTQYTVTFTTQATCNFVDIQCRVTGNDGTATLIMDAWFDDLVFRPTAEVTRTAV